MSELSSGSSYVCPNHPVPLLLESIAGKGHAGGGAMLRASSRRWCQLREAYAMLTEERSKALVYGSGMGSCCCQPGACSPARHASLLLIKLMKL